MYAGRGASARKLEGHHKLKELSVRTNDIIFVVVLILLLFILLYRSSTDILFDAEILLLEVNVAYGARFASVARTGYAGPSKPFAYFLMLPAPRDGAVEFPDLAAT